MGDRPLPLLLGEASELKSGVGTFQEVPRTTQSRITEKGSLTAVPFPPPGRPNHKSTWNVPPTVTVAGVVKHMQ